MAATVIPVPEPVLLPVEGTNEMFPVRRVYCVGRNYADHAIEMGHDPSREPPFYFQKNPDNLLPAGQDFLPFAFVERALRSRMRRGVEKRRCGYSGKRCAGPRLGLRGWHRYDTPRPSGWFEEDGTLVEGAKAFEYSAPVSAIVPADKIGHPSTGAIWLDVNGERKQTGDLAQMIWKVPEVIAELSKLFTLAAGDVIMTGTPAGVGPIVRGDRIECGVDGVGTLSVTVA